MIGRIIVALLIVIAAHGLLVPLFRVLRFPLSTDLELILRILVSLAGLLYVVRSQRLT